MHFVLCVISCTQQQHLWSYSLIRLCKKEKKKCNEIKLKEKRKGNAKKRLLVVFLSYYFLFFLFVHKLQARHTVATIIKIIGCYGMRQLKSMTACPIYIYFSPHALVQLHRYQHRNKMATAVVQYGYAHFRQKYIPQIRHKRISVVCKKKITLPKVMIHRRHTHF